jgi:ATP-dependent protease ClpP protease subunit
LTNWYSIRALDKGAEISIHDEIGACGVTAKAFLAELKELESAGRITLRINSPGGSVFDGIAIYNALRRHPARITVVVEGIAASIASVIVCAGDEVVMPENAMLMLHEPSAIVSGTADDLLSMAAALEKMRAGLVAAYRGKSGLADAEIENLLNQETWLSATEALEMGFADRMEQPVKMAACFDLSAFRNAPDALSAHSTRNEETPMSKQTKTPPDKADNNEDKVKPVKSVTGVPETPEAVTAKTDAPDTGAEIIDLDAVRAAERKATLAYVTEVNELCALASQADLASGFIARATPVDQVRKTLLQARAAEDEATAIRTHKTGEITASAEPVIDTAAIYAARNKLNHKEGA